MSNSFPSKGINKKFKTTTSADNTAITTAATITVPTDQYGAIYWLYLDLDVASQDDIEALPASLTISVTIGSTVWSVEVHPYIAHDDATNFFRHVDLGPWRFDFGDEGLYSGVKGDDIVVAVDAAGTGIKTKVNYQYTGD